MKLSAFQTKPFQISPMQINPFWALPSSAVSVPSKTVFPSKAGAPAKDVFVRSPRFGTVPTTDPVEPNPDVAAAHDEVLRVLAEGNGEVHPIDIMLGEVSSKRQAQFKAVPERMSFSEFLKKAHADPRTYLPQSAIYTVKGIEHFGVDDQYEYLGQPMPHYKAFDVPWESGNGSSDLIKMPSALWGHHDIKGQLVDTLFQFITSTTPDRGIMLIGPHGSGKTQFTKTLGEILEQFSKSDEGVLYTLEITVPEELPKPDSAIKEMVGDNGLIKQELIKHRMKSKFRSHPIFLLPKDERARLIRTWVRREKDGLPKEGNYDYYLKGDLEHPVQSAYEAMVRHFNGDMSKVWPFIEIVRWRISKTTGLGYATVPANDAEQEFKTTRVTDSDQTRQLAGLLDAADVQTFEGPAVNGNNGLRIIDDFGRGPGAHRGGYNQLLYVDKPDLNLPDGSTQVVNSVTLLTANFPELEKVKDIGALMQRVKVIVVPLLRTFRDEEQVYRPYYRQAVESGKLVTPNILEAFSLWTVMSRLHRINPTSEHYAQRLDDDERKAVGLIEDNLMKALLYQQDKCHRPDAYFATGSLSDTPSKTALLLARQSTQDRLRHSLHHVVAERSYRHRGWQSPKQLSDFEGMFGVNPRLGADLFRDFIYSVADDQSATVLDVLDFLGKRTEEGIDLDRYNYEDTPKDPEEADAAFGPNPTETKEAPSTEASTSRPHDAGQIKLALTPDNKLTKELVEWMEKYVRPHVRSRWNKVQGNIKHNNHQAVRQYIYNTWNERVKAGHPAFPPGMEVPTQSNPATSEKPSKKPRSRPAEPRRRVIADSREYMAYLRQIEDFYRRQFITDLKISLGMFKSKAEYIAEMKQYIHHVEGKLNETVIQEKYRKNPHKTEADDEVLSHVESIINHEGLSPMEFRDREILQFYNKRYNRAKSEDENIEHLFSDYLMLFQLHDAEQNREKTIDAFVRRTRAKGPNWFMRPVRNNPLANPEDVAEAKRLKDAMTNMVETHPNYPAANIVEMVRWALSTDYVCDGSFKRKSSD